MYFLDHIIGIKIWGDVTSFSKAARKVIALILVSIEKGIELLSMFALVNCIVSVGLL